MSSQESIAPAVKGAHTVFLVTNFWESMSSEKEISQGKAVTDACKAAGVQHIIFSALIDVSKASQGRLAHVTHFDGKAAIEQYIRDSGVKGTFVLPGFFMSNMFDMIQKGEDGAYTLALPCNPQKSKIPVFNVAEDMGRFAKPAIRDFPEHAGKRILAATDFLSPEKVMEEFSSVTGKTGKAIEIPPEVFKSFLPEAIAEETCENMMLLEEPGYYGKGADLSESLAILDEKPTAWKEFVETNKSKWT